MTYSDTQPRGTLRYRLLSASLWPAGSPLADPGTWGHEYVRHLAAELGDECTLREQEVDAPSPTPAPEAGKEEAPAKAEVMGTVEDLRVLAKECAGGDGAVHAAGNGRRACMSRIHTYLGLCA
jgi:26S proteasome regulatory subunit N1